MSHAEHHGASEGMGTKTKVALAGAAWVALWYSGVIAPAVAATMTAVKWSVATLSVTNPLVVWTAALIGAAYVWKKLVWDKIIAPVWRKVKGLIWDSGWHGGHH